jgi:hypothetical protein
MLSGIRGWRAMPLPAAGAIGRRKLAGQVLNIYRIE